MLPIQVRHTLEDDAAVAKMPSVADRNEENRQRTLIIVQDKSRDISQKLSGLYAKLLLLQKLVHIQAS